MSNQFGIKEVLNCTVFDFTTGAQLFYFDYLNDSSIETTAERLDLRGGQGNYKLLSFDYNKDMMFKAIAPLVDLKYLSYLSAKPLNIGAVNVPKREVLFANASNTITLSETPVTGTLKIYKVDGRDVLTEQTVGTPASNINEYSISTKTITLNATTAPSGSSFVCTYSYVSPTTTKTVTITADKFAGYVRIVGEGVITDEGNGETVVSKFDIKKAKVKNNFTLSMKSTEATNLNMEFDMYPVDISNGAGGIDKVFVTFNAMS